MSARALLVGLVAMALVVLVAVSGRGDDDQVADDGTGTSVPATEIQPVQIPGGPREDTASAVLDRQDQSFPEPLVDPSDIRPGGPPPDGIPSIDLPRFNPVSEVDWLEDAEPVLFVEIGSEARAYPVRILTQHEIVNDTFGDLPVTVSYCPLCNSALTYVRRIDDRVFTFGTSGSLLNSSLVMYDRQTQSLWSHFNGQAVVGALTGTRLELIPTQMISWAAFRDAKPDGLVLSRNTGFDRSYGRNPYVGYDDVDQSPFLYDGPTDDRLAAAQRVLSIQSDDESVAIVQDYLFEERVVVFELDGRELVALLTPGTASALDSSFIPDGRDVGATGVFVPEVDGRALTFSVADTQTFIDAETDSTWNLLGQAIEGPLAGSELEPVEHLDTFWFAIAAFRPDTVIIGG